MYPFSLASFAATSSSSALAFGPRVVRPEAKATDDELICLVLIQIADRGVQRGSAAACVGCRLLCGASPVGGISCMLIGQICGTLCLIDSGGRARIDVTDIVRILRLKLIQLVGPILDRIHLSVYPLLAGQAGSSCPRNPPSTAISRGLPVAYVDLSSTLIWLPAAGAEVLVSCPDGVAWVAD